MTYNMFVDAQSVANRFHFKICFTKSKFRLKYVLYKLTIIVWPGIILWTSLTWLDDSKINRKKMLSIESEPLRSTDRMPNDGEHINLINHFFRLTNSQRYPLFSIVFLHASENYWKTRKFILLKYQQNTFEVYSYILHMHKK